ncbi:MAG TPA: DUF4326 domain-containing protein [Paenisporosarcina sp.]|nr:DUF4326 domain-containing protein [Paenisporosarcina sp.]
MKWVVHFDREPCDIYIGRPTRWSNPYHIGIHGTREEVLEMYEAYVYSRPELIQEIRRELRGKVLGCHCEPLPCHGQLLARIANGFQLPPLE